MGTYAARLTRALTIALNRPARSFHIRTPHKPAAREVSSHNGSNGHLPTASATGATSESVVCISESRPLPVELSEAWNVCGGIVTVDPDGAVILSKQDDPSPGSEQGLTSNVPYENVCLSFEVFLERGFSFIAKIHQQERHDHCTNSYHLFANGRRAYLARHHCVLGTFALKENAWIRIRLVYVNGRISVRINDGAAFVSKDDFLPGGYCFLGVKGGRVRLRAVSVTNADEGEDIPAIKPPDYRILCGANAYPTPELSIITTVYDRVECLERCLRSVNGLSFPSYEHIIVADCPGEAILRRLHQAVEASGHSDRRLMANLETRHNNWGIAPAAAGLSLARGKYVAFLSDDNGYLPDHFQPLITALQNDTNLGFVYSSCLYAGRLILRHSIPRFGGIDLGQPVFRRHLFDQHCDGVLPFTEPAWDWRMIELLVRKGVRWRHVDRLSFIFRLASYPNLVAALP